jgi:uncharacterized protein YjbI with pentapeptide repeats
MTLDRPHNLTRTDAAKRSAAVLLCVAVVAVCFTSGPCYGFKQADLDKLLATGQCEWCDLSNADLSKASLSKARLPNANLSSAILSGADLAGADLSSAILSRANLSKADLTGAYLSRAYLSAANLTGANLSRANLTKARLSNATLTGADLTGADLSLATWDSGKQCEDDSIGVCKGQINTYNPGGHGGVGVPY